MEVGVYSCWHRRSGGQEFSLLPAQLNPVVHGIGPPNTNNTYRRRTGDAPATHPASQASRRSQRRAQRRFSGPSATRRRRFGDAPTTRRRRSQRPKRRDDPSVASAAHRRREGDAPATRRRRSKRRFSGTPVTHPVTVQLPSAGSASLR
nr:hypothetical protein CFP56_62357 [Quercus suber]